MFLDISTSKPDSLHHSPSQPVLGTTAARIKNNATGSSKYFDTSPPRKPLVGSNSSQNVTNMGIESLGAGYSSGAHSVDSVQAAYSHRGHTHSNEYPTNHYRRSNPITAPLSPPRNCYTLPHKRGTQTRFNATDKVGIGLDNMYPPDCGHPIVSPIPALTVNSKSMGRNIDKSPTNSEARSMPSLSSHPKVLHKSERKKYNDKLFLHSEPQYQLEVVNNMTPVKCFILHCIAITDSCISSKSVSISKTSPMCFVDFTEITIHFCETVEIAVQPTHVLDFCYITYPLMVVFCMECTVQMDCILYLNIGKTELRQYYFDEIYDIMDSQYTIPKMVLCPNDDYEYSVVTVNFTYINEPVIHIIDTLSCSLSNNVTDSNKYVAELGSDIINELCDNKSVINESPVILLKEICHVDGHETMVESLAQQTLYVASIMSNMVDETYDLVKCITIVNCITSHVVEGPYYGLTHTAVQATCAEATFSDCDQSDIDMIVERNAPFVDDVTSGLDELLCSIESPDISLTELTINTNYADVSFGDYHPTCATSPFDNDCTTIVAHFIPESTNAAYECIEVKNEKNSIDQTNHEKVFNDKETEIIDGTPLNVPTECDTRSWSTDNCGKEDENEIVLSASDHFINEYRSDGENKKSILTLEDSPTTETLDSYPENLRKSHKMKKHSKCRHRQRTKRVQRKMRSVSTMTMVDNGTQFPETRDHGTLVNFDLSRGTQYPVLCNQETMVNATDFYDSVVNLSESTIESDSSQSVGYYSSSYSEFESSEFDVSDS